MPESYSLLLLGCGHMGNAMLRGWRQHDLPITVNVVKPTPIREGIDHYAPRLDALPDTQTYDVVMLATPPQIANKAMAGLSNYLHAETLVISVMVGKTLAHRNTILGGHDPIVRVMPNMPSSLGQGICGYVTSNTLNAVQQSRLDALLHATGVAVALQHEDKINIVTALSGSGPAYAFLLIKAMADAGVALGLEDEQARLLAMHTVAGAGQYALQTGQSAEELLGKIAIKGGTTEAALKVLNTDDAFGDLLNAAIHRAYTHVKEVG